MPDLTEREINLYRPVRFTPSLARRRGPNPGPVRRVSGWRASVSLLLSLLASAALAEPRVELIEHRLADRDREALLDVETLLREDPQKSKKLGLQYLKGHLLLELGHQQDALQAFATAMVETPSLEPFSRFRMAVEEEKNGHPEVAAGLLASLLGTNPPGALSEPAMRLLARTIEAGGDCRLLTNIQRKRWRRPERRALDLTLSDCTERAGDLDAATRQRFKLLEANREDGIALAAAQRLEARTPTPRWTPRQRLLLGLTFYNHREFEIAIEHLAHTQVQLATARDIDKRESFECHYALARSHFWLGRYEDAARAFKALADPNLTATRNAQVLYQAARSLELAGHWPQAIAAFQEALQADSRGPWSDAALIASMRLHWLRGQEPAALQQLQGLLDRRQYDTASRAALFLASSELVEGRAERAGTWLDLVERLRRVSRQELAYWRGREMEVRGQLPQAVTSFTQALTLDPFHPFAEAARKHLDSPALAGARATMVRRLRASRNNDDLFAAWLLLPEGSPERRATARALESTLRADPPSRVFLDLEATAVDQWPVWKNATGRPEDLILRLGVFQEASSIMLRHFPVAQPSLAFTGSSLLAQSGSFNRSLYIAEVLARRIPSRLPDQFLPEDYRKLLFPMGYSFLILRESKRYGIDPFLLAGIIREESRFDPGAFSGAAARGLTQFVLPTAKRIARKIGLDPIAPDDLSNPQLAIALGAAYLQELGSLFDDSLPLMVAAYNAGEPQAILWRRYCMSDDPAELLTKVTFRETRNYLRKVLTSRAHYLDLYSESTPEASIPRIFSPER